MTRRFAQPILTLAPRDSSIPAYLGVCDAVRTGILEGRLRPGARLPSTRELAKQHCLSRGTIVSAFDQLRSEGYITGTVGSGTFVSGVLLDDLLSVRPRKHERPATSARRRTVSSQAARVRAFESADLRPVRAFRANRPAVDLFPTSIWAQIASRRARNATSSQLVGCGSLGYAPLQEAIADYVRSSRGVNCEPGQVVVVSGVQEALDLATRLLVNPGDVVCLENPGYTGAARVFDAYGARIARIRVDNEGMHVPGPALAAARLCYVTPAHQFPLGISMSLARRLALLEWARTSGAMVFEDDYDSEFRYSGRPLPALQGLDRNGVVMFAGSFSKVLFPSIRLGYMVVPTDLVERIAAVKSITSRHASVLEQAVLCDFMVEGHFGRHVRRMRETYAERLGTLIKVAGERLDGLLGISQVEAGLQTVGWLRGRMNGESVAEAAAERQVEVIPLSRFGRGNVGRNGLQMGFAAVDSGEIRRGIRELAIVLEKLATRTPRFIRRAPASDYRLLARSRAVSSALS